MLKYSWALIDDVIYIDNVFTSTVLHLKSLIVSRRFGNAAMGEREFLKLIVIITQRARCGELGSGTVATYDMRGVHVRVDRFDFQSGTRGTLSHSSDNESVTRFILLYEVFTGREFVLTFDTSSRETRNTDLPVMLIDHTVTITFFDFFRVF